MSDAPRLRRIHLVGSPNVGKSLLFTELTGRYATVSNYPGTTVEVLRGRAHFGGRECEVVDTPGAYSLLPVTEEERVTRTLLATERPDTVVHVVDLKNLERQLPLTLQLLEAGLPVLLVLNMADEAERLGLSIDAARVGTALGVKAIVVSALDGRGLPELRAALVADAAAPGAPADFPAPAAVASVASGLKGAYGLGPRLVAGLLLQEDTEFLAAARVGEPDGEALLRRLEESRRGEARALSYTLALQRQCWATRLAETAVRRARPTPGGWAKRLGRWTAAPWPGGLILLLVLWLGMYEFVGGFGAGTLVDWIETSLFEERLNPWAAGLAGRLPPALADLFAGEYGIFTLGVRYAVAIVLPIVGTFFLVFALLEDSGYLPRLAMLSDRLFKRVGLSGRAVIPMVLGLGCATMATLVTRTLPTRRERLLATLLLSLAVPCSAQLGLILAVLAPVPGALALWLGVVAGVFLVVGAIGARVLPGEPPLFFLELPPLRRPDPKNVLVKTAVRMRWYFGEIFPLFLAASVLIWLGRQTGLFDLALAALRPPTGWLGLPPEAAVVFLFGFFRRDYGAAGLYDLCRDGALDGNDLVVAAVVLTLFLPCIAQLLMNLKERGWRTGMAISAFVLAVAFGVGLAMRLLLDAGGIRL